MTPVAGGLALLVVGAILTFALTGSVQGVDLRVAGVILMLAGVAALILPSLVRTRRSPGWPGRVRSRQDAIDDGTLVELPDDEPAREAGDRTRTRRRLRTRWGPR